PESGERESLKPWPARSSATISQPGNLGASRSKLPALSSQPCEASTGRPPASPYTCAASVSPCRRPRRATPPGQTLAHEAGHALRLLLLLERRARTEALVDELLQALLLLVEARARQQENLVARLEARDHLAVLEVRETRPDGHGHGLVAAQCD